MSNYYFNHLLSTFQHIKYMIIKTLVKGDTMQILCIGICGFFGSILRYLLNLLLPHFHFPLSTLIVNIVGAFLLAYVYTISTKKMTPSLRLALGTITWFILGKWITSLFFTSLPFGTLIIHIIGSFFIRYLIHLFTCIAWDLFHYCYRIFKFFYDLFDFLLWTLNVNERKKYNLSAVYTIFYCSFYYIYLFWINSLEKIFIWTSYQNMLLYCLIN